MKKTVYFFLLAIVLTSSTCNSESEICHKTIIFINNLPKSVYISRYNSYPDTLLFRYSFPNPATSGEWYKVVQKSTNDQGLANNLENGSCYETSFTYVTKQGSKLFKSDTLCVYIFDAQVVENTPWETVGDNYMVLQRYDLSLSDLQQIDWIVSYPPTEAMKDIKMWPPYETD